MVGKDEKENAPMVSGRWNKRGVVQSEEGKRRCGLSIQGVDCGWRKGPPRPRLSQTTRQTAMVTVDVSVFPIDSDDEIYKCTSCPTHLQHCRIAI